MKIQTNAGEVELTAEMVRPGMVFQAPGREPYTLHRRIVEFGDWVGSDGMAEKTEYLLDAEVRTFLGCDPAIAAREDVERYGVAPGIDAAENGFARLPTGGAIDLAKPENVRKGMLFRVQVNPEVYGAETRDIVAACDGNFGIPASAGRFLGCHPEIARREDCERFGIPERVAQNGVQDGPIDAGTHGFARLRGGGAVDLRRGENAVSGMVLRGRGGDVVTTLKQETDGLWSVKGWPEGEWTPPATDYWKRFIGLDARYANPEDVGRLCCGAQSGADGALADNGHGGTFRVLAPRCTLAIGDHDTHEDIATGTRWPAQVAPPDALPVAPGATLDRLAAAWGVERLPAEPDDVLRGRAGREVRRAMRAAAATLPGACDSCGVSSGERHLEDAHEDMADGQRWTDDVVFVPCDRCGSRVEPPSGFPMHVMAQDEAGAWREGTLCDACGRTTDDVEWRHGRIVPRGEASVSARSTAAGFPLTGITAGGQVSPGVMTIKAVCGTCGCRESCPSKSSGETDPDAVPCASCGCRWCGPMTPEARRRAAEAPLVALVNAVPKGLDPVGWRAAVLAATDHRPIAELVPRSLREIERLIRSGEPVPPGSLTSVVLG